MTNPLDLYYYPYTHSLVAAVGWSVAAAIAYRLLRRGTSRAGVLVGLAVLSHWVLDFVVHRPDLPLYAAAAQVGLGLWDRPVLAFALEAALVLLGLLLYLARRPGRTVALVIFTRSSCGGSRIAGS